MNNLNKKLKHINESRNNGEYLSKVHNVYKDQRFWDWMYLEVDDKLVLSAVLDSDDLKSCGPVVSNGMNIPTKTGKNYGKK